MKRLKLLIGCLILAFACSACSSLQKEIDSVPKIAFKELEYHRAGNGTSADITATGARVEDGKQKIDSLKITADYGPFVNFNVKITGYERDLMTGEDYTMTVEETEAE